MKNIVNFKMELDKFINQKCTVEDLSRSISSIAIPNELLDVVAEIEYKLEKIRFCVSDQQQYEEGMKVINPLMAKIKELYFMEGSDKNGSTP